MPDKKPVQGLDFHDLLDLLGSARSWLDDGAPAYICWEIDDVLAYYRRAERDVLG
jgi:hypothetical protein